MLFGEIISAIERLVPCTVLSNGFDAEISSVRLVDPKQTNFDAGTLYFGYNIQLIASLPQQCVLAGEPDAVWPTGGENLAVLSQADFISAFNEANRQVELSRKSGFYDSMMSTLERVKNVDALIDIASRSFGASLIFIDRDFRILSHSTQVPVRDVYWQRNIEQGFCDYEFITAVRSLPAVKLAGASPAPFEVSCPSSPFQKFAVRVYCHDVWIGFLIVIEDESSYRKEHVDMLRMLCGILGYAVLNYAPNLIYRTDEYHKFLYSLIIGADVETQPETYRQLAFPAKLRVLYCRALGDVASFPGEAQLFDAVNAILPGSYAIVIRHHAAIIGSAELQDRVESILSVFPKACRVRVGVSRAFDRIEMLKCSYDEAQEMCRVGMLLEPEKTIYSFDQYGVHSMLIHASEHEDLSRYLHGAFPILLRYDAENDAKLTETLRVYLNCNCSIKETAERLFLHRNSLLYRLNRIRELCNIDLGDVDTCFQLRLSLMLLRILELKQTDSM